MDNLESRGSDQHSYQCDDCEQLFHGHKNKQLSDYYIVNTSLKDHWNIPYIFRMKIEVSNGDLLDRYSILELKSARITDAEKLPHIQLESAELAPLALPLITGVPTLYRQLQDINALLWDIEDRIREFESRKLFGDEFIETARSVYLYNDQRAALKKQINQQTGSRFAEEKSYRSY